MMFESLLPAIFFGTIGFALPPEHDKAKHFAMGAAGAFIAKDISDRPWASCGASFGLGVLKEAYDARFGGDVDPLDALATGAGCSLTFRF